jgi:hypothetical protein
MSLYVFFLPVLEKLIYIILSHQIVDIICICYPFMFAIILLHDISFVIPDLVMLLFNFQFIIIIIIMKAGTAQLVQWLG